MAKSIQDKRKGKLNFYQKMKILKQEYKIKQNLYADTLCRLIKQVSREMNKNQSEESVFQAKVKTIELSLVATESQFKKMTENCCKKQVYDFIVSQINKIGERKTKKKCQVIALVNYIRKLIKGIQASNKMDNLQKV